LVDISVLSGKHAGKGKQRRLECQKGELRLQRSMSEQFRV